MMTFFRTAVLSLATLWLVSSPSAAQGLSTSILRPTAVDPATGLVAGAFPGGNGATSYYLAVDLQAGTLMTQLQVSGRQNTPKRIDFELLDENARPFGSAFVMAVSEARRDLTRNYAIDAAGRYVIRLIVDGKETNAFCVLLGGTAMPNVKSAGCPSTAAAAVPARPVSPAPKTIPVEVKPSVAPVAARPIEVLVSKCEERLRIGSDLLFDFDRAELRAEADPAMAEVEKHIRAARRAAMIEGHTDGKGTDAYNQALSERRAATVRSALAIRGVPGDQLATRGFGKSRPVAANSTEDGRDYPEGRQKNRRVEVVINTCD